MNQRRKHELKERIAASVRKIADTGLQALATSSLSASTDSQLAAFSERALQSAIPPVIEQLRTKMIAAIACIDAEIEAKERERTLLVRTNSDDLLWRLEEAMQIAMDILRRVMPEAALAHANIEFAESITLPIATNLLGAIEQSEKAQHALFLKCVAQVQEVMDSLNDEVATALSTADQRMGGGVFSGPSPFRYRPPQHFFIDFYAALDRYEQLRVSTQGMSQIHSIRLQWMRNLLLRLPRFAGMNIGEIVGGVSGFDSLTQAKRIQLRRELASIAAEQRRRVMIAAHEQASTSFRELKWNVLTQSRSHYFTRLDAIAGRLSELGRERRKALDYWGATERSLREAEGYARELLALTASVEREAACIA